MAALSEKQFLYLGLAAVAGVIVVGYLGKKAVGAAADVVTGTLTGNNAVTKDTPYEGAGVLGTLGAVTNAASGGTLQQIGESIGSKLFDWFGPKVDLNQGGQVIEGEYKVKQQLNNEKAYK
jgi:hypothetical protein